MWKIRLFRPGQVIRTGDLVLRVSPAMDRAEVAFPARIHITLIDSNRFDFGKPGAGGMGFAVQMRNKLRVAVHNKDEVICPKYIKPVLLHILCVMKKVFSFKYGLKINLVTDEFFRPHKGLGYTTTITTACAEAINILFGSPLSKDNVKELVSINYGEVKGNILTRGTETGVGPHLVLNGGFVVVGGESRVVYSRKFFPDLKLALIDPGCYRIRHKGSEHAPIMRKIQNEDLSFRYQKAYLTIMDLIPALYCDQIERIGSIIWRFQFGGNNLYEFDKYTDNGKRLMDVMCSIRYGCGDKSIVGFSSVGPIIYVITRNLSTVKKICDTYNVRWTATRVDNTGLTVIKRA